MAHGNGSARDDANETAGAGDDTGGSHDDGVNESHGDHPGGSNDSADASGDGHGAHAAHPPTSAGRPVEDLPGALVGSRRSGDAAIHCLETDAERLRGDRDSYLAVVPRTPYNDVVLPFTSLSAVVERDGDVVRDGTLRETLDGELGHHYGRPIESLRSGDRVTVRVDTPPQVSRHDGYETAFLKFDPVEFVV